MPYASYSVLTALLLLVPYHSALAKTSDHLAAATAWDARTLTLRFITETIPEMLVLTQT